MRRCHFSFDSETFRSVVAHGGVGEVSTVRVVSEADCSGFTFVDLTEIPPQHSVGTHTHGPHDEEAYVIISGHGRMLLEDKEFDVGPGDVILNVSGGTHGLANVGSEPLRMVVLDAATLATRHGGR